MSDIFEPAIFDAIVEKTCRDLSRVSFDTIVFRGFSGALLGPIIALRLQKRMALVRKPGDSSHSCEPIEGVVYADYIIIDDFISTGDTVKKIVETVTKVHTTAKCIGFYLYSPLYQRGEAFGGPSFYSYCERTCNLKALN